MSGTAKGFGYSIYFMLALVFGLLGTITGYVVRTIRREERALAEGAEKSGAAPETPPPG